MITVIEWTRRQQFESKKLASEYFKIPVRLVDKSIANNSIVTYKHHNPDGSIVTKKYKFAESWGNSNVTRTIKASKEIPFGKYKGKKPSDVPLGYLIWMYKKTACPKCVVDALKEVEALFK